MINRYRFTILMISHKWSQEYVYNIVKITRHPYIAYSHCVDSTAVANSPTVFSHFIALVFYNNGHANK